MQRFNRKTKKYENWKKHARERVKRYYAKHMPHKLVMAQMHATLFQRVRDDVKHCVCLGNSIGMYHIAFWTIPRLV